MQQGLRQEMQLLPRMLQSIEVLQLAVGELAPFLQEAALENEALVIDERPAREVDPVAGRAAGPRGEGEERSDRHAAWLESLPEDAGGLAEHLEEQLSLCDIEPDVEPWVRLVIHALEPSGELALSDEALLEMAREQGLSGEHGTLGRAIAHVQGLEPRGVGGRDMVEMLLLQLDPEDVDYALMARLLEECLEDVATNKLPLVARALSIDLETLSGLLGRLRSIDPAPGAAFSGHTPPPIVPDVVVERLGEADEPDAGERFEVRVLSSGLPAVSIDEGVRALSRDPAQESGVRRYLRDKLEKASWILEAVEQRQRTLLRVASWIFEHQKAFLREGQRAIVPLTMTACAEDLGLHLSTVSRAVSGKHAETPHGIVALRALFPTAAVGRPEASRGSVQEALAELVSGEDPEQPFSDEDLARALKARGFAVARRTAAKYRKELGIPSSYRRRRYLPGE